MAGWFPLGVSNFAFTPAWQPLRIGAGGQITAIYIYADGTTLIRTDTYGAYLYKTGGTVYGGTVYTDASWQQLVTGTSIPSPTIDMANGGGGVTEIVAAPSNTNVLYMLWEGFLYVSINKGVNWFKTTQTTTETANSGTGKGPFLACDPNNADILYIGTPGGVFKTTNGTASASAGTTTFSAVAGITTPSGTKPVAVIAFQPGSSTHILIGSTGTGVYESTNGSSFALTTGSNATFSHIVADQFNQFWMTDNGSNSLYKYASSTWSTITPGGGVASVAVDPNSGSVGANHVVVTDFAGQPNVSSDNGGTWTGHFTNQTFSASGSQPGWLGNANQLGGGLVNLNGYSLAFDSSSNLWFAGGIGVWNTVAPVVANATPWTANSLGIEQLVTNQIISPSGGCPVAAVWDRGFFTLKNTDTFPSNYWDSSTSLNAIMGGWNLDWASNDPTFITGWQTSNISASIAPASSTDGGNTWTLWAATPSHTGAQGGNIAALTNQKWALIAALGQPITFTANGGGSWATSTIAGTPTNWTTGTGVGQALAADRVAANTFCAVTTGQVFYSSTDAGANFAATGATSANVDGSPNQFFLRSVPGKSGHYFYSAGGQGGTHPTNTHLWKSTNTCASFSNVNANLKEVIAFGFGAIAPTGTYPTIYVYGWLSGTLGFHQSIDGGATWTTINVPASQTPWPLNSVDLVTWIEGDPNVYGRIYVGFRGSGACYIDTADACPWVNFSNVNANAPLTGTVTLTSQHSGLVPVTSVQYSVDGINIGSAMTGAGPYSFAWNTAGVAHGAHTLKVTAIGVNGTGSFSIPITTS